MPESGQDVDGVLADTHDLCTKLCDTIREIVRHEVKRQRQLDHDHFISTVVPIMKADIQRNLEHHFKGKRTTR